VRVQCKWASCRGDVIVVPLYSTRRAADGLRRTYYSANDVDAFAAYAPGTGCCYYAEFAEIGAQQALNLRLGPTRNNQAIGVRWAKEYEFAARLRTVLGP